MSILINVEMPQSCSKCPFAQEWVCVINRGLKRNIPENEVTTNYCPLIEIKPHGRLIDADAFKKYISVSFDEIAPELENGYLWLAKRITEDLLRDIDEAPTIIEAEEEQT